MVDKIKNRDKVFKKFKKSKLLVDKDNAARYKLLKMIFNKRGSFEIRLTESMCELKDLWKSLKSLYLPNKISSCDVKILKIKNAVERDVSSVLKGSKNFNSSLVENLVQILPKLSNNYSIIAVIKYYEHIVQGDHFNLTSASENSILAILKATSFKNSLYGQSIRMLLKG